MYGLIDISIKNLISDQHGDATWSRVLERAGLTDDIFISNKTYDDAITYGDRRSMELLFPFGFAVDRSCKLVFLGPSFMKMLPEARLGQRVEETLGFTRPEKLTWSLRARPSSLPDEFLRGVRLCFEEGRERRGEEVEMSDGRVLVAEDNPTNQKVIGRMLEKLGLKYQLVASGGEVLDSLNRASFDLILMDCQMPEMDGYEATRRIRQGSDSTSVIPIVALTANAVKGDEEKCREAGMNAYLSKPIGLQALEGALRRYLDPRWIRAVRASPGK
jgi:CheY-like chemotaxis protein